MQARGLLYTTVQGAKGGSSEDVEMRRGFALTTSRILESPTVFDEPPPASNRSGRAAV